MTDKKIDKILMEIYSLLYTAATPSADFKKLVKEAPINYYGQKIIDFNAYEIDDNLMSTIIKRTMEKYKVPKHLRNRFELTVILGCSPRSKR